MGRKILPFGLPGQPVPSTRFRSPVGVLTAASAHRTSGDWNCLPVLSPSPRLSVVMRRASRYGELTLHLVSTLGASRPAGSSGPPVSCSSGCCWSSSSPHVFPQCVSSCQGPRTGRRSVTQLKGGGRAAVVEVKAKIVPPAIKRGVPFPLFLPAAPPPLRALGPAAAPCSPPRTPNMTPHTRRCCKWLRPPHSSPRKTCCRTARRGGSNTAAGSCAGSPRPRQRST